MLEAGGLAARLLDFVGEESARRTFLDSMVSAQLLEEPCDEVVRVVPSNELVVLGRRSKQKNFCRCMLPNPGSHSFH